MATQNPPKIVGAINQGGRTYLAGDEDAFAKVLNHESIERLTRRAAAGMSGITGDWSSTAPGLEKAEAAPAPAETAPAPVPAAPKSSRAPRPRRSRTPKNRGK